MARKKKPRRTVDEGEQQDIEGTREYNAKIDPSARAYVQALKQRQAWQADENNLREKAMAVMEEEGVDVYYTKTGHKIELVDKGRKLKVTSPKDEDGKVDEVDRQMAMTEVA